MRWLKATQRSYQIVLTVRSDRAPLNTVIKWWAESHIKKKRKKENEENYVTNVKRIT